MHATPRREDALDGERARPRPGVGQGAERESFCYASACAGIAKGPPGVSRVGWLQDPTRREPGGWGGDLLGFARLECGDCGLQFHRGSDDRHAGGVGILAERYAQGA